jgi:homoserine O-succinyltransferase
MPLIISEDLPAFNILATEGIEVMGEARAARQDIRPMRVALLNLMPDKITTETQISRLLGASPLQIDLSLLVTGSYTPKNVPHAHLRQFYQPWEQVAAEGKRFDALIVTGAPVEQMPYEEVQYWPELTRIFDWAQKNVFNTLAICWGAQAALYHHYRIPKHDLPAKMFGIYSHFIHGGPHSLLRGFNDIVDVPVSRHTEVLEADLAGTPLQILLSSPASGLCLVRDETKRLIAMFNHWEYDNDTLAKEYFRDKGQGKAIDLPHRYFIEGNPEKGAHNAWRSHAYLFFSNWLNDVYQATPYDLAQL